MERTAYIVWAKERGRISTNFDIDAARACFAASGVRDLLAALIAAAYRAGALGDAAMLHIFRDLKDGSKAVFLLPLDFDLEGGIFQAGRNGARPDVRASSRARCEKFYQCFD